MNQIEAIKAEIERLMNKYKYLSTGSAKCKTDCYSDMLSFIDSLPDEQPSEPSEDLKKEIKRFLSNATKMNKGEWRGEYHISEIGFRAIARHFAEWQKEQMMKGAITCEIEWYDGLLPNFTEEQIYMYLVQHEIAVGDKVKIIIVKEDEK